MDARRFVINRPLTVALASAAMAMCVIGSPVGAATVGGNLADPAAHTQSLPDDSATGPGVTSDAVSCPSDFPNPVGGGIRIDGADSGLDLEVHSSTPTASGWSAAGNNNAGNAASMTTFAICAKGTYLHPSSTKTIRAGRSGSLKVSCPQGSRVIGGGVSILDGDHAAEFHASEPADGSDADHAIGDAWYGSAGNGSATKIHLKVTAICDGSSATYKIKWHTPVLLTTNHKNSAQANCPAGTRLVGGGADVTGANTDMEIHEMYPVDGSDSDALPDNGFKATGYNDGDPGTRQLNVAAICKVV